MWKVLPAGLIGLLLAAAVAWGHAATTKAQAMREPPPDWAFAIEPPAGASDANDKPAEESLRHVPGSDAAFTLAQTHDFFHPPDWHPEGHPAMPEIVAHGRKPDVFACAYCHLPNGLGRPENASLAGLPAGYIVQQVADFKSGLRKSAEPRHGPTNTMSTNETKAEEQEIQAAAAYFSVLKRKPWIRVVETDTVPKTHVAGWMLVATEPREMEPVGTRIIETPENLEQTELRDDASGFIAYVPAGSIRKGSLLVKGVGEKTIRCVKCHGPDFHGHGNVPPIAGGSPSYMVRQLYDMQSGARAGKMAQFMKPVVANLSVEDMLEIAAYIATLRP
jgi:cytochrome c553